VISLQKQDGEWRYRELSIRLVVGSPIPRHAPFELDLRESVHVENISDQRRAWRSLKVEMPWGTVSFWKERALDTEWWCNLFDGKPEGFVPELDREYQLPIFAEAADDGRTISGSLWVRFIKRSDYWWGHRSTKIECDGPSKNLTLILHRANETLPLPALFAQVRTSNGESREANVTEFAYRGNMFVFQIGVKGAELGKNQLVVRGKDAEVPDLQLDIMRRK
jgi:hypothetical protein